MRNIWIALRMLIVLTALTGIAYPLFITAIAKLTMPRQANGDFIEYGGKRIGCKLIGQPFTSDAYFWPRPSAANYNALASGGSNLAPTSAALKKAIEDRRRVIKEPLKDIPPELLMASGSGLDPHISPITARFQIDRVLRARNIAPDIGRQALERLIDSHTEVSVLPFLGPPHLNVLMLNIALDKQFPQKTGSKPQELAFGNESLSHEDKAANPSSDLLKL